MKNVLLGLSALVQVSCIGPTAPQIGPSVQGTADVEAFERNAPVTAGPDDSGNAAAAAYYATGGYDYRHRRYGRYDRY